MKYDKIINIYLKEAAYGQRRSNLLQGGTKKGSVISSDKTSDAEKYIRSLYSKFDKNPEDISALREIVSTVNGMESESVLNKTRKEFYDQILGKIKKSTGMDVGDIITRGQEGSNGRELTIDQWKEKYGAGSEIMYNVLRDILNSQGLELSTKGRNVREAEGGQQIEVFYFGENEEPIRTTVFVDSEGKAPKGAFWATNRFNKAQAPKPIYTSPVDGKTYKGYNPKVFRGADIETIKQAVKHDDAKIAFVAKYPRNEFPSMYSFGGKKKESQENLPLIQTLGQKKQLQNT